MLKTIVLYEKDASMPRVLQFKVPSEGFDLQKAVRDAALEYAATKEGREAFGGCDGLGLATFMEKVPDFFCRKHGFEKLDESVCIMKEDEGMVLSKGELPKEISGMEKNMTPKMQICNAGVEFGRIWGVMETLGYLPNQAPDVAALWAMEFLDSEEKNAFEFFERKMKEL